MITHFESGASQFFSQVDFLSEMSGDEDGIISGEKTE